jgi:hypothetical protein
MPRGGHARSGPRPDPMSARSERRGFKLDALPAEGYDGDVPEFPLPATSVYLEYFEERKKVRQFDETATTARRDRELELWQWAWRTPQACAWSMAPWRWHAVAMWVRTSALCESSDATAADKNSLHRFADQIGLTPAGLKENGWSIVQVEPAAPRAKAPAARAAAGGDVRSRLRVVPGVAS